MSTRPAATILTQSQFLLPATPHLGIVVTSSLMGDPQKQHYRITSFVVSR
jgi:hypothetical protein